MERRAGEDSSGAAGAAPMPKQRKRVRVTYSGPPAYETYRPEKSFRFLATAAIPSAKHHRSQLLHLANVMIEEMFQRPNSRDDLSKVATGEEARQLRQFSDRLAGYVLRQRSCLSRRHRMLAWIVRLRAGLIARKCLGEYPKDYGSLARLAQIEALDLLVSERPVPAYSLSTFWRSLRLLVERLDTVKYHEQIAYYAQCLEMCCAKFALVRSDNLDLFDYVLFRQLDNKTKMYGVNEAFFEETERLFYGLHERLDTYQSLSWTAVPRRADNAVINTAVKRLHAMLLAKAQGPFVEFIERDLRAQIYEWHVLIGERERYDREEKFGDPTGRNIITHWRQDQADRYVQMLVRPKIIQSILDRMDPDASPPPPQQQLQGDWLDPEKYANVDLDGLILIVLNYVFDEVLTSRARRFAERFALSARALRAPSFCDEHRFPLIVKVYNEYAVYFDGKLLYRGDVARCFIEWVRVACEKSSWHGGLPNEPSTVNLLFLYKSLFPRSSDMVEDLSRRLTELSVDGHEQPYIPLPEHYGR